MIKQSPLIEVFRVAHQIVEDWLHLKHRTKRHTPRDMHKTIEKLVRYMAEGNAHVFWAGQHKVYYQIPDQRREGWLRLPGPTAFCTISALILSRNAGSHLR
jgi:hypothetical protein